MGCSYLSCFPLAIQESFELWYRSQSQDSKTSELSCLYEVFFQRETLTMCHDEIFASLLSVLSLSSVVKADNTVVLF